VRSGDFPHATSAFQSRTEAPGTRFSRSDPHCIYTRKSRFSDQRHGFCVSADVEHRLDNVRERWEFRREQTHWRWRRLGSDGGVIAASSEKFTTLRNAIEDARRNGFSEAATR
jgi:hypothetical protein